MVETVFFRTGPQWRTLAAGNPFCPARSLEFQTWPAFRRCVSAASMSLFLVLSLHGVIRGEESERKACLPGWLHTETRTLVKVSSVFTPSPSSSFSLFSFFLLSICFEEVYTRVDESRLVFTVTAIDPCISSLSLSLSLSFSLFLFLLSRGKIGVHCYRGTGIASRR